MKICNKHPEVVKDFDGQTLLADQVGDDVGLNVFSVLQPPSAFCSAPSQSAAL